MRLLRLVASALVAATLGSAHPGANHEQEMIERRSFLQHTKKNLGHCAEKMRARGLERRSVHRRARLAADLNKSSKLQDRDLGQLLNVSHHSSSQYNLQTPETTIFASNNSCVLSPETIVGPYYVAGEYVRKNVTESEPGVAMAIDLQIVDVNTCNPIPGAYLEIWHCNSTGVYSGVGSGANFQPAPSNLNNTFLRGAQRTDTDGVAQFNTLFPGHYTGRATHIHVLVHLNATPLTNGTIRSSTATHVGQIYFDQDLINQVETLSPYTSNPQNLTTNENDFLLADTAKTSDPFMEYVLLGEKVGDGLLAWLSFGVNTTLSSNVTAAATYYKGGGVSNPNFGGGPGGGPPPPFPSGPWPSLPPFPSGRPPPPA